MASIILNIVGLLLGTLLFGGAVGIVPALFVGAAVAALLGNVAGYAVSIIVAAAIGAAMTIGARDF